MNYRCPSPFRPYGGQHRIIQIIELYKAVEKMAIADPMRIQILFRLKQELSIPF